MGGEWRGARLIGFATESDYTLLTPAPPFLFTCGLLDDGDTPWHARFAAGWRLEAGGLISGFEWRHFNCQLDLSVLPLAWPIAVHQINVRP